VRPPHYELVEKALLWALAQALAAWMGVIRTVSNAMKEGAQIGFSEAGGTFG